MRRLIFRRSALALLWFFSACDLLDVSDPTAIEDAELANATGAGLLRTAAIRELSAATSIGALASGMLADELLSDPSAASVAAGTITDDEYLDRRDSQGFEQRMAATTVTTGVAGSYAAWQAARRASIIAVNRLRAHGSRAQLGELHAMRGLITLKLAEDFCPGFPLHDLVDYQPVYSGPVTTAGAFARALEDLDSAVVMAVDSSRILNFAKVARARALLGLGRFSEARQAVTGVPTAYVLNAEYSATSPGTFLANSLDLTRYSRTRSVADREGGVGIDFVSANDPRVRTTLLGTAVDGVTRIYASAKYPNSSAPIVLASGLEARLIEAEAALHASDPQWLTLLNGLRQTAITPAMPALSDPGDEPGRVNLLFRERAFWLFATGHRLADLRRLIDVYGRSPESTFPSGAYRRGGVYHAGTSLPFPAELEARHSPSVTGCTVR